MDSTARAELQEQLIRIPPWNEHQGTLLGAEPEELGVQLCDEMRAHSELVWVKTSGSTRPRWYGLSKSGLLASACAVNDHFRLTSRDRWAIALPTGHIGGFSIKVRAFERGFSVVDCPKRGDPDALHTVLCEARCSIVSLVPTQLHDLVMRRLSPPPSMRIVVIGGGPLHAPLAHSARSFGWPIVTTYGLTEASSQVGVATPTSDGDERIRYTILPHLEVSLQQGARIALRGPSVAQYLVSDDRIIPLPVNDEGWFVTTDLGTLCASPEGPLLIVHGRADRTVKRRGHLIPLEDLEQSLSRALSQSHGMLAQLVITPIPHPREGCSLVLHLEQPLQEVSASEASAILGAHAPISTVIHWERLPRLGNGKLDMKMLQERAGASR